MRTEFQTRDHGVPVAFVVSAFFFGAPSQLGWGYAATLNFMKCSTDLASIRLKPNHFEAHLNHRAIGKNLWLRTRETGDRFHPLGMDGTQKLKKFMIDTHIPRIWRDHVPLVVGDQGIAWVVGWRIAHWARVTLSSQQVVEILFSRQHY